MGEITLVSGITYQDVAEYLRITELSDSDQAMLTNMNHHLPPSPDPATYTITNSSPTKLAVSRQQASGGSVVTVSKAGTSTNSTMLLKAPPTTTSVYLGSLYLGTVSATTSLTFVMRYHDVTVSTSGGGND